MSVSAPLRVLGQTIYHYIIEKLEKCSIFTLLA